MTRTPEQTSQALTQLFRRSEDFWDDPPPHIEASPEKAAHLRSLVDILCDRADELEQLAIDLFEAGCPDMAYHVWTLHCDATYYLDDVDDPGGAARKRVAGILDGTYKTD